MRKHPEKALNAAKIRNANSGRYADGNGLYLQVDSINLCTLTTNLILKTEGLTKQQ